MDADRLNDPERSIAYARELLRAAVSRNKDYLKSVIEPVGEDFVSYADIFIDAPDDERR